MIDIPGYLDEILATWCGIDVIPDPDPEQLREWVDAVRDTIDDIRTDPEHFLDPAASFDGLENDDRLMEVLGYLEEAADLLTL